MSRPSNSSNDDDSDSELGYQPVDHGDSKPISLLRLEKIASVSAAIALWNHVTVTMPRLIKSDPFDRLKGEILKCIDVIPMPKLLSESIERHFYALRGNFNRWITYLSEEVFVEKAKRSVLYEHIDRIIWHHNGTINAPETVKSLIKSIKLTNPEKFRLACMYCLQEDVERLWPNMGNRNYLVSEFQLSEYPLVYFWGYYCADNLVRIRTPGNVCINEFMIQHWAVNNWSAIEYFFDRFDAEKQVTQAIWLIDDLIKSAFQKFVLAKLDESQRLRVVMDRFVRIMVNYTSTRNIDDDDLAISISHYARDFITEKQFVDLFSVLLKNHTKDFVLTEIWNTAREDLKLHIMNYGDDDFIKSLLEWCVYRPKRSSTFLSAVLMDYVSADIGQEITKKTFFSECCERLIRKNAVKALDQLINSCFPTAEESTKFKWTIAETLYFDEHCESLVGAHNIQALANLLDFVFPKSYHSSVQVVRKLLNNYLGNLDQQCLTYYSTGNLETLIDLLAPLASSYPEIIFDYKSKLLMSNAGFHACVKHFGSTNYVLVKIIADGIPENQTAEFKKRIIFSHEGINNLYNMMIKGYLSRTEKWACLFLESDADKNTLRSLLIDRLKDGKRDVSAEIKRRFLNFLL
ncbi:uncharacterized protein LOC135844396 isoform X10 [Planococcus citri]|uniref:uncharacterized protein LOC135844396 isoform X10 n=1 Tax=Planococcus citri TaxID=170843 RepID=UPI0031F94003